MLRIAAKQLVEQLGQNPRTIIIPQTNAQFQAAFALYSDRSDKTWSLTDCASFLIMKARAIDHALTYDKHFEQMGLVALLRESAARED
ncbi:MAG TPA: nucleic acid-binding protein, partial [Phycisphaerae bacterium]|nr:nucleic acid-binding protein [Phycisphaerae bacterium]